MDSVKRWSNDWSGVVQILCFIGLILFWVFGMQTGINGLTKGQEGQKEFQKQTILVLTEIRDSLKDRGTDHILFSDKLITNTIQLQKNTVSVAKLSEAVVRISFALEGIEKSMNRKP